MTILEAAKQLAVSRGTVYRMIEDGRLQVVRRPHLNKATMLVVAASVEALLRGERGPGAD